MKVRRVSWWHNQTCLVSVRLDNVSRGVERTYTCTVTVEGRINIAVVNYDFDTKGSGSSTVTVTGE